MGRLNHDNRTSLSSRRLLSSLVSSWCMASGERIANSVHRGVGYARFSKIPCTALRVGGISRSRFRPQTPMPRSGGGGDPIQWRTRIHCHVIDRRHITWPRSVHTMIVMVATLVWSLITVFATGAYSHLTPTALPLELLQPNFRSLLASTSSLLLLIDSHSDWRRAES